MLLHVPSAVGREEHLTAAALFWNSRKVDGLAMSLCKRLSNTQKQKTELSTQLLEVGKYRRSQGIRLY